MTVGRFRFIVCSDFVDKGLLRVVEYETLATLQYAAVSYPWDGLKNHDSPEAFFWLPLDGQISDPISLAVLRTACLAARQFDAGLLWIDQICINQTSKQDKDWQISQMFDLYDRCKVSLVLPGGLQRLAAHDERTNWIERSWTLQEAMPKCTYTIFAWKLGSGEVDGLTSGCIHEIEKGQSAMMDLGKLLQASYVGFSLWNTQLEHVHFNMFGPDRDPILALMAAKEASVPEMRDMAVWRSALLRTCSHPRDMILSIMGIFGVTLNVGRYGKDDRDRAAVDLAFEILRNGRGASWLGAAPGCGHLPSMCTMPAFPVVDGREVYYSVAGHKRKPWDVMGSELDWYVKPTANASMEERGAGLLHLTAKTLLVELADLESQPDAFWSGFSFTTTMILDEGPEKGKGVVIDLSTSIAKGGYRVLELGLVKHFCLPATSARAQKGAALLMILAPNSSMERWQNVAYGTIKDVEDVTKHWPTCFHVIGF
ncbi:hypothetical protein C8A00DRAFT_13229 [Chaetomidium leptoderma]|uniref:Heterokaryon incompatibility domain-containing protein n=1 Tax=Chaetomidium leptoderma TaxID=669021 RepID=A0AAN6VQ48_9PEZI|nr:hypothetical protein C8A00DRAFT_13229 [Chaetomidium leptoderma]